MNLSWAANVLIPSIIMNWPKRKNTTTTKNIEKKKAVFEQSTEPERQKMSLENSNEIMEKDADEYLTDDEENKVIQFLVSGNKLRKVVKVNIAKIKTLEAEIQNLERKLKEMPANWAVLFFHNFVYFMKIIFAWKKRLVINKSVWTYSFIALLLYWKVDFHFVLLSGCTISRKVILIKGKENWFLSLKLQSEPFITFCQIGFSKFFWKFQINWLLLLFF